ncbi:hypothetical protein [Amycolatopsis thermophila]|uniref:Phage-related protein n=1 Tax=Amycolatopsis thermophila TaxID=206084 RepID=A0ABU0F4C6_9PSEU|nr:hypothetical protein [Amycolatopsis thermophila]MDQ0382444.1 hypothetical protein [Amycolatopsis thermophila]
MRVRPDLTGFRQELRAGLARIDDDFRINVRADLDTGAASRDLAAWRALESSRGTITQEVRIDRDKLRDGLSDLAGGVASFGRLATSAAMASTQIVSAANAAATVGPLLASAAGVGALLPAAIVPAVGILAAVKLGADGAKKAFEGTKGTVADLRKEVSSSFEKSLEPAVRNVNKILPGLTTGLKSTATALGGIATQATKAFSKPEKIRQVNDLLVDGSRVTQNLGKAFTPVVEGFVNIASIGIPTLVQLTRGAGSAADRFRDWTASAEGTKQIEMWIRGGVDAFHELWDIAGDVVDIGQEVIGVFREAGIGVTGGLGPAVTTVKEFVQSAEGHATIRTLADTIKLLSDTVQNTLAYAFETLGPPLQHGLEGFQDLVEAVGPHLPAAIDLVGDALEGAGKIMSFVAGIIDDLPDGMVDAAIKAGVLYLALKKFGGLKIAKSLASSFGGLPSILGKAEKDVAASGTRAASGFGAKFKGALGKIGFVAMGATIVEELTSGIYKGHTNNSFARALGLDDDDGAISGAFKLFKTGAEETVKALSNPGHTIFDDIIPQMRESLGLLPEVKTSVDLFGMSIDFAKFKADEGGKAFGDTFRGMATSAWDFANSSTAAVGTGVAGMTGSIWSGMGQMQDSTLAGWAGIVGATNAGGQQMADATRAKAQAAKDALAGKMVESIGVVGSGWAGIVGSSNSGADGMIGAAHRGAGGVRGAFSDGGWFGIGSGIVSGIGSGIAATSGALAREAAQAAKNALAAAKNAIGIHSPSRAFRDEVGKQMMAGWKLGVSSNERMVVGAVRDVADELVSTARRKVTGVDYGAVSQALWAALDSAGGRAAGALADQLHASGGGSLTAVYPTQGGGIDAAVERALSSWSLEIDRQGVLSLSRQATRDNLVGR